MPREKLACSGQTEFSFSPRSFQSTGGWLSTCRTCGYGWGLTTLTIWGKLVSVEHGETQHVLVKVLDEELAVEIPLGIQGVLEGSGGVALRAHADLTVGVALSYTKQSRGTGGTRK